jgi:hypothetical protein
VAHVPVKVTRMRKSFASLDDALIERLFQPLIDGMTNRIGIARGSAACCCIDFASLSWIVSRTGGLSDAVASWDSTNAFLDLFLLLLGLVALVSLRTLFRRVRHKQGNPLRVAMQPYRAVVLLMLAARVAQFHVPNLADAADIGMLLFAAAALYLGACTERPPVRRSSAVFAPAA